MHLVHLSVALTLGLAASGCATPPAPSRTEALAPTSNAHTPSQSATPAATAPAATAPGKSQPGVTANCAAWSNVLVGPYKYDNNQWGYGKAKGPFEQCLLTRTVEGRQEVGWTWSWPGFDPSVFAYPEIIFGWKPWGGAPTDNRFPMRVGDVELLVMHYDVETSASGGYNLAPELWLLQSGEAVPKGNPEGITTEIMFWMEHAGGAKPAGEVIDTPSYGGIEYELWKKDNLGDKGNGQGWLYYALKSPVTQRKGSMALHEVLANMVQKGQIDPEHYVAGIEFGNEIFGGSGTTWVKRFEVEARAR